MEAESIQSVSLALMIIYRLISSNSVTREQFRRSE